MSPDIDDELAAIDQRIASAWAALSGARAATWHSPNRDSVLVEELCERTVNELLEKRYEMTHEGATA